MSRPLRSVTACIATHGRLALLASTLRSVSEQIAPNEIIVVSDGCRETEAEADNLRRAFPNLTLIALPERVGPGKAKHHAVARAQNNICLVIDDDTEIFDTSGLAETLAALDGQYSLVQSGIFDATGITKRKFEYPARSFRSEPSFEISYFVGAIHWLRKDHYLAVGGYSDLDDYGFEELSLSIRLLRDGRRLWYSEGVKIKHLRSPLGRKPGKAEAREVLRNRAILADKYFPGTLAFLQKAIWSARHALVHHEMRWPAHETRPEKLRWPEIIRQPRLLSRALF